MYIRAMRQTGLNAAFLIALLFQLTSMPALNQTAKNCVCACKSASERDLLHFLLGNRLPSFLSTPLRN